VDGLRYYDTEEGRGKAINAGDTVVVSNSLPRFIFQIPLLPAGAVLTAYLCQAYLGHTVSCMPLIVTCCLCWPVQVHFDCRFRGIDAVSSRYARTLGGNRTIAEVRPCPRAGSGQQHGQLQAVATSSPAQQQQRFMQWCKQLSVPTETPVLQPTVLVGVHARACSFSSRRDPEQGMWRAFPPHKPSREHCPMQDA